MSNKPNFDKNPYESLDKIFTSTIGFSKSFGKRLKSLIMNITLNTIIKILVIILIICAIIALVPYMIDTFDPPRGRAKIVN